MARLTLKLVLLVGICAVPVSAEDLHPAMPNLQAGPPERPQFTLRVPVRVSAIHPEVTRVAVRCYVQSSPAGRPLGDTQWTANVPLDGTGSYNGTVVVSGSLPAGVDPHEANHYWCGLILYRGGVHGVGCVPGNPMCDSWRAIKPGTRATLVTTRSLP